MPDISNSPVDGLYYPIIIIGAGISGIGCACQLERKLRFHQFMIFEGQGGIGVRLQFMALHARFNITLT